MRLSPKKIDGYRRRLVHEWGMWRGRQDESRRQRRYDRWLASLSASPPDVFLGPDLPYGGVRGHIHAIAKHSALRVEVIPNEKALGGLDQFYKSLQERFLTYEPPESSVVHSHVIPWYINWCREQQARGLRWVHTYHLHYFPEHGENGILRADQVAINEALNEVARHADVLLSVAKWQCEWLRREHAIDSIYLPNGVDVTACDRGRADRFRKRYKLREPFALWVGRNDPVKNPLDFVRLAQALPQLHFVVIGAGLTPETLPRDMGASVPPNLTLTGPASHSEVQDALAACSSLVVTSKREGLPTLVLEGMAHGKPVVVPDESGCLEAVGGGEYGQVYRQGDLADLISKTKIALSNPESASRARARVLEEYDWRVIAPKLDRIYAGEMLQS